MLTSENVKIELALIETGLADDIDAAKKLINFGLVFLKDKKLNINSTINLENISELRVLHHKNFVGRGAYKLETVFDKINIDVKNFVCLDIGASTGGFCDLLLKKNVAKIFAVDVGKNLLDEKIKKNKKVINLEGVNARFLSKHNELIKNVDFCVLDLSFISIKKVVPELVPLLKPGAWFVPMVKPQFECNKKFLKKGILENKEAIAFVLRDMEKYFNNYFIIIDIIKSKLKGQYGNQEYFFVCRKG